MCTAGARLGLTATLPEDAGRLSRLKALVGPESYRTSVEQAAGSYLASFRLIRVTVALTETERREYDSEVSVYHPMCQTFFRVTPGASWRDFAAAAAPSPAAGLATEHEQTTFLPSVPWQSLAAPLASKKRRQKCSLTVSLGSHLDAISSARKSLSWSDPHFARISPRRPRVFGSDCTDAW